MSSEALQEVGGILLGAGLTILSSYLLGRTLLALFPPVERELTAAEHVLFSFAVGTACLSGLVFVLCASALFYDASVWLLAGLIVAAAAMWARRSPRSRPAFPQPASVIWSGFLAVVGLLYGGLYLIYAAAPEISADGVAYHLGLVRRYYGTHGFPAITTNIYAYLSQGAEMLYLFAYAVGRHSAAKLVHFSLLVGGVSAMLLLARRFRCWPAGVIGAVLYACSPVVGPVAASTYNGCALAFFQFMTFYALVLWWKGRQGGWLPLLGILAGFCFSIKYTGYLAVPLVLAVVAWGSHQRLKQLNVAVRRVLVVGCVAGLFVAPWLIKNALLVDNPTAPFFNKVFPNPYVTVSFEHTFRSYLEDYSHADEETSWLEYALELTVRGARFQGLLGPAFLLVPLALLAWRRPFGKALLVCSLLFALPWLQNAGTRFLIPALMFWSLGLGLVFGASRRHWLAAAGLLLASAHAVSSWPSILHGWHEYPAFRLDPEVPWKAALRSEPEEQYLARRVDGYMAAAWLRRETELSDRIFSLEVLPEAYFDSELLVYYQGAENEMLVDVLRAGVDLQFQPTRALRVRGPSRPMSGVRIVQRAAHPSVEWRVLEVVPQTDAGPVSPEPDWTIRARPFPWTAARIFDGNPFTGWSSWEPLYDGMSIEVEFPSAIEMSGLDLVFPWNQHHLELEFFGKDETGEWVRWETESTWVRLPVSLAASRAWFGEELRRRGISFFVSHTEGGFGPISRVIEKDPAAWGLREEARHGPLLIYRVEERPSIPPSREALR